MVRPETMSRQTKKKKLINLIEYAEENGFNKILIDEYKRQLEEINAELSRIKDERERFKFSEEMKGGQE